ncbi:MAG: efflux RND transporter permease subunit, partial [Candidatus Hydrogenedentales bacterium]
MEQHPKRGLAGSIAHAFIDSKLTPLVIGTSILLGIGAVLMLPREEEPQIIVPMIDIYVQMPGASAREVEERVTKPMEKLVWEIPGVEYIYSTSAPGMSSCIVRFYVGQDEEDAIVRLNQKMFANFDLIPPGASQPLVKPRSIDDVPILALTLSSARYDHFTLRRIAAQLHDVIKEVPNVSEVSIIGGHRRQLRVVLDTARMAAHGVAPVSIVQMLQQANAQLVAGSFSSDNREFLVESGAYLRNAGDVGSVVVGVSNGSPVYLRNVAEIIDGAEEPADYVFFASGPSKALTHSVIAPAEAQEPPSGPLPAVTISVAKRKGANAIVVADQVIEKVRETKGTAVPSDVRVSISRNYGETAREKSNELLYHMFLAIVSVAILIAITLGVREAGTVGIAIPVTLALTLVVFYFFGYTLNRVTLFALIFSSGILVDDAIVVVENIVRHYHLPESRGRSMLDVSVEAVNEVGNPTLLATAAVIA